MTRMSKVQLDVGVVNLQAWARHRCETGICGGQIRGVFLYIYERPSLVGWRNAVYGFEAKFHCRVGSDPSERDHKVIQEDIMGTCSAPLARKHTRTGSNAHALW